VKKTDTVKNRAYNLVFLAVLLLVAAIASQAAGASSQSSDEHSAKEYRVKAAFIYNFMKFIEWPRETTDRDADGENPREPKKDDDKKDEPIVIGMVCDNPFGKAFEPIIKKKIDNKKVIIRKFEGLDKYKAGNKDKYKEQYEAKYGEALRKCKVLFVYSAQECSCEDIIGIVKDSSVLTIGETKDFAAKGGIIGFVVEKNKVRFEVNLTAAKRANLKISSKLLRLAKRVIKEKKTTEDKK
jgi:hypothetical protein